MCVMCVMRGVRGVRGSEVRGGSDVRAMHMMRVMRGGLHYCARVVCMSVYAACVACKHVLYCV